MSTRIVWRALFALGAVLVAAGCGADNPGEPRTPAEDLMAPSPQGVDGRAHVYCVEEDAPVTPCSTWFNIANAPSRTVLRDWWLLAAARLRHAGTFPYKDGSWRFSDFELYQEDPKGHRLEFGWRCAEDAGKKPLAVARAMERRAPLGAHGIQTLSAARSKGCTFSTYPDVPPQVEQDPDFVS